MLGVTFDGAEGLGDLLQFSSFPENYYRNTGERVVDVNNAWIFDHNPFVVRGRNASRTINLWRQPWPQRIAVSSQSYFAKPIFFSIADRTASIFDQEVYLKHPRLYVFENLPTIRNRLVIHTTGKRTAPILRQLGEDQSRILPPQIIEYIRFKYRSSDIIQVGSLDDVDAQVTDCRGLENIWDTVRIIAQATMFIGVDSGPAWIAACYPEIFKKKILVQYPPEFLRKSFVPMHLAVPHHHWHDFSFMYYNRSEDDAGVTYSYLKV
jgi:hypothetical protein